MEWFPQLGLGWLYGWTLLAFFGLAFGLTLALLPRGVVRKLYDRSEWTPAQRVVVRIGKVFGVALALAFVLSPLRVGSGVFVAGMVLYMLGLAMFVIALVNYRNMPDDGPAEGGLYRVSRNPQWVALVLLFAGGCMAVGSWTAMLLLVVVTALYHVRIRAEERSCLALYGDAYAAYMRRVPRYFLFF
jgi:protein-S-isoprenylcysteine O-methyltransferase Ste14